MSVYPAKQESDETDNKYGLSWFDSFERIVSLKFELRYNFMMEFISLSSKDMRAFRVLACRELSMLYQ